MFTDFTNFANDKEVCEISFIIVFIFVLFKVITVLKHRVKVIEENPEGFGVQQNMYGLADVETAVRSRKNACPFCNKTGCGHSNFYVKGNRYSVNNSGCPCGLGCKCGANCKCSPNMNCGPGCKFYNGTKTPGANGTLGDNLWNYMSPRMILEDGSMRCRDFNNLNPPKGVHTDKYGGYENISPDDFSNYDFKGDFLTMAMENNMHPDKPDCAMNIAFRKLRNDL